MLKEQTLFGEIDKVDLAIRRIKLHEPPEGYYVAFSGGKDSCVILDLVKRAGVKFSAHLNITTVDIYTHLVDELDKDNDVIDLRPVLQQILDKRKEGY